MAYHAARGGSGQRSHSGDERGSEPGKVCHHLACRMGKDENVLELNRGSIWIVAEIHGVVARRLT
jgi:hypothetical protein